MGRGAQGKKPCTLCAVWSKPAASQAWQARGAGPLLSRPRGWALPRGSPNDPSSPSCRQTPLFLWFLEPARPRGVSSTSGGELSLSSTPGKYLFRALAPAEEEMKATLEPSGRCGRVALSAPPDCLRRPGARRLGPGPGTPPHTQTCFGGELGVLAVGSFSSGVICQFSQQTFLQLTVPGTALGPGRCR